MYTPYECVYTWSVPKLVHTNPDCCQDKELQQHVLSLVLIPLLALLETQPLVVPPRCTDDFQALGMSNHLQASRGHALN